MQRDNDLISDETQQLLGETERALPLAGRLPVALRDQAPTCKRKILANSSDQNIPVKRPSAGRWFDDATAARQMIADNLAPRPAEASMAADGS